MTAARRGADVLWLGVPRGDAAAATRIVRGTLSGDAAAATPHPSGYFHTEVYATGPAGVASAHIKSGDAGDGGYKLGGN